MLWGVPSMPLSGGIRLGHVSRPRLRDRLFEKALPRFSNPRRPLGRIREAKNTGRQRRWSRTEMRQRLRNFRADGQMQEPFAMRVGSPCSNSLSLLNVPCAARPLPPVRPLPPTARWNGVERQNWQKWPELPGFEPERARSDSVRPRPDEERACSDEERSRRDEGWARPDRGCPHP